MNASSVRRGMQLLALLSGFAAGALSAQTATVATSGTAVPKYETRAALEAQAQAAESQGRTSEAWLLRSRLKTGDFQEGDRILMLLENDPTGTDTIRVRSGNLVQLARMADLSLQGVLRSELTDTLRRHLGRYLRNPEVRAIPLLSLAVIGSVRSPGYYYTAADVVLRDVIMSAGVNDQAARLTRIHRNHRPWEA